MKVLGLCFVLFVFLLSLGKGQRISICLSSITTPFFSITYMMIIFCHVSYTDMHRILVSMCVSALVMRIRAELQIHFEEWNSVTCNNMARIGTHYEISQTQKDNLVHHCSQVEAKSLIILKRRMERWSLKVKIIREQSQQGKQGLGFQTSITKE